MFSNDRNIETIAELVESLKRYLTVQKEYVKLDVTEKVVRLLTFASIIIVLLLLLSMALIYASFAVAFALSPLLGTAGAFACVAAFYLLLLLAFMIKRKSWIERPLVRFLAGMLIE